MSVFIEQHCRNEAMRRARNSAFYRDTADLHPHLRIAWQDTVTVYVRNARRHNWQAIREAKRWRAETKRYTGEQGATR